ncbi:MAG: DUF3575 domain-containing protein [Myxococcota bacterium]|nr:DUF3575 domain-containing protein [Myxococcota bacterium]
MNRANGDADVAAHKANTEVVGSRTQSQNEANAMRPRHDDSAKPGSNATGAQAHASSTDRRRAGTTSMQSGDHTSDDVGGATASATNGVDSAVRDVTRATDKPGHYDPFALEWNPLGLFVGGRVSFNAEWAPLTHHVITVSPHFVHTTADVATSGNTTASQAFSGFGAEVGYRYYTGQRGMNGVFVGPSLLFGAYNASLPSGDQGFANVGIAADVGVQQIFWDHLVVGGGLGLEYLSVNHDFHDLPTGPSEIASSGIKPRVLLEAGYGF